MPAVIWPDGHYDSAPTWEGVFDLIRSEQWHDFTRAEFRRELGRRCLLWSGVEVDVTADYADLFLALEGAGFLRIVEEDLLSA